MTQKSPNARQFFYSACYFEASLIIVAIILGWLTDINPFQNFYFSENALAIALLGTIPLLFFFNALHRLEHKTTNDIKKLLFDTLCTNLQYLHWSDLLLLSTIAGISEELLFRGVIQIYFENISSNTTGLIISNLIFGFVHAITPLQGFQLKIVTKYYELYIEDRVTVFV